MHGTPHVDGAAGAGKTFAFSDDYETSPVRGELLA